MEPPNNNVDVADILDIADDYENQLELESVSDCEEEDIEHLSEDDIISLYNNTSITVHHGSSQEDLSEDSEDDCIILETYTGHTVHHYPSFEDLYEDAAEVVREGYLSEYEEYYNSTSDLDGYLELTLSSNFGMADW